MQAPSFSDTPPERRTLGSAEGALECSRMHVIGTPLTGTRIDRQGGCWEGHCRPHSEVAEGYSLALFRCPAPHMGSSDVLPKV